MQPRVQGRVQLKHSICFKLVQIGFYKFGLWTPCKAGGKAKSIDHGSWWLRWQLALLPTYYSMYLTSIAPIVTFSEALSKRCFSHKIGIGTGSSITLAPSAQILFSEMLKFSKLTLYKEQIRYWRIFWNVLECSIFGMESSKLVNHWADICWSCPCSTVIGSFGYFWTSLLVLPSQILIQNFSLVLTLWPTKCPFFQIPSVQYPFSRKLFFFDSDVGIALK